jgi:hypothetical protein
MLSVLQAFLLFFYQHVIDHTVAETKRHVDYCILRSILKAMSHRMSWQSVISNEIYVVLDLIMLTDIVQKPTLKSYFRRDVFVETLTFPQTMTQDSSEL